MAVRSSTYLFWQKYLGHPLQAIFAWILVTLVRLLPLDTASNLGGWIARKIGPGLKVTNKARHNLKNAFPEKAEAELEEIILGMWDNLGRTAFEFPHLGSIDIQNDSNRFEVVNSENFSLLDDENTPAIYWGGHLANWEVGALSAAHFGRPCTAIFRAPDNQWVSKLFFERGHHPKLDLVPKGSKGAKKVMGVLKAGGNLGILVDQKMNDGIAVPFFGRDAMTAPALATFALKYKCNVVPARIERLGGAPKFRITIFPAMVLPDTGDRQADTLALMTDVNAMLEGWIKERPEQWLWLHKRWPN